MINTGPIPYRGSRSAPNRLDIANSQEDTVSISQLAGRYETFVDVVCAGARFGASEALEVRYLDCRNWLLPRIDHVATVLAQHNASNPDKIAELLEKVIVAPSLTTLLHEDDGSLIQRMSWVSQALFDASGDE